MVKRKGYIPKQRNSGKRKIKRILLISTEGNKNNRTESIYFQHFRSDRLEVHFVPGNETDPETLVRRLIDEYKDEELGPDDLAVCVVDSDFAERRNQQLAAADKRVRRTHQPNIVLAVSSPCFEVWFICHFLYSTKQYQNVKDVMDELHRFLPAYKKSLDVYPKLHDKEDVAIRNAEKLETWCVSAGKMIHQVNFMPSTEVYKIVKWTRSV